MKTISTLSAIPDFQRPVNFPKPTKLWDYEAELYSHPQNYEATGSPFVVNAWGHYIANTTTPLLGPRGGIRPANSTNLAVTPNDGTTMFSSGTVGISAGFNIVPSVFSGYNWTTGANTRSQTLADLPAGTYTYSVYVKSTIRDARFGLGVTTGGITSDVDYTFNKNTWTTTSSVRPFLLVKHSDWRRIGFTFTHTGGALTYYVSYPSVSVARPAFSQIAIEAGPVATYFDVTSTTSGSHSLSYSLTAAERTKGTLFVQGYATGEAQTVLTLDGLEVKAEPFSGNQALAVTWDGSIKIEAANGTLLGTGPLTFTGSTNTISVPVTGFEILRVAYFSEVFSNEQLLELVNNEENLFKSKITSAIIQEDWTTQNFTGLWNYSGNSLLTSSGASVEPIEAVQPFAHYQETYGLNLNTLSNDRTLTYTSGTPVLQAYDVYPSALYIDEDGFVEWTATQDGEFTVYYTGSLKLEVKLTTTVIGTYTQGTRVPNSDIYCLNTWVSAGRILRITRDGPEDLWLVKWTHKLRGTATEAITRDGTPALLTLAEPLPSVGSLLFDFSIPNTTGTFVNLLDFYNQDYNYRGSLNVASEVLSLSKLLEGRNKVVLIWNGFTYGVSVNGGWAYWDTGTLSPDIYYIHIASNLRNQTNANLIAHKLMVWNETLTTEQIARLTS